MKLAPRVDLRMIPNRDWVMCFLRIPLVVFNECKKIHVFRGDHSLSDNNARLLKHKERVKPDLQGSTQLTKGVVLSK